MARTARVACFLAATLLAGVAVPHVASGQEPSASPASSASAPPPSNPPPKPAGQGIAVLAIGPARDEAFALARAVYGSRLRPTSLDEVRARVLAGAPPPSNASRELIELAEVRAGVTGEDAAGRRLLTGLAQQVGAQALLVVRVDARPARSQVGRISDDAMPAAGVAAADGGAQDGVAADGGAAASSDAGSSVSVAADAGAAIGNAPPATTVVARLFLADSGDFDAARYSPEPGLQGAAAWRSTVTSLEARFPAVSRTVGPSAATAPAPVKLRPEEEKSSPFYTSGWFWGAVAGAALIGGAFYFLTRDTGSGDPIHLQMTVPK